MSYSTRAQINRATARINQAYDLFGDGKRESLLPSVRISVILIPGRCQRVGMWNEVDGLFLGRHKNLQSSVSAAGLAGLARAGSAGLEKFQFPTSEVQVEWQTETCRPGAALTIRQCAGPDPSPSPVLIQLELVAPTPSHQRPCSVGTSSLVALAGGWVNKTSLYCVRDPTSNASGQLGRR